MRLSPEYTAGLFDGDGTVSIFQTKTIYSSNFYVITRVINTHRRVLDLLQEQFGGSVVKHMKQTKVSKQSWAWKLAHKDSGRFLDLIYPYVIIKKPAVTICRDFILFREDIPSRLHIEWKELINYCNRRGPTRKYPRRKESHALKSG